LFLSDASFLGVGGNATFFSAVNTCDMLNHRQFPNKGPHNVDYYLYTGEVRPDLAARVSLKTEYGQCQVTINPVTMADTGEFHFDGQKRFDVIVNGKFFT
jgi:hypothetical protein